MIKNKKIKAVIFDLDGVLVEAKEWHYLALNKALETLPKLETIEGHSPKGMCIQRTGPKQGYHVWHVEDGGQASCNRVVAYTLYLNDVKEGGETEYLYQGVKVKPEEGKLVFWPAGYTHPHRGNPIYEGYKYIITGWYTYDS